MSRILLLAVCCFFVVSCSLDDLIFAPEETTEYQFPGGWIPEDQLNYVTFESEGLTLWGLHASQTEQSSEDPPCTAIYFHGREASMNLYWYEVIRLYEAGMNVFLFDYRGFGRSEGKPSLEGLYADSRAALEYVIGELNAPTDRLIYFGNSLGSGMACYLAAEVQAPYRLILMAPYSSATHWADVVFPLNLPPTFVLDGDFNNMPFVEKFTSPLLVLCGGVDRVLPFEQHGRVVYEAAPEPKQLVYVSRAGHDDIAYQMGEDRYRTTIRTFVNAQPGPLDSTITIND